MPLLCLDTATDTCIVAVVDPETGSWRGGISTDRAQGVLALIDGMLEPGERAALTGIVVGTGPGGFTGLRVGVATARGMAEALGVPLLGVSSMLVTAASVESPPEDGRVWAVIRAGRGEHFVQTVHVRDDELAAIDEVGAIPAAGTEPVPMTPAGLARAATHRWRQAGASVAADSALLVLPTYGREPDAVPPRMDVVLDVLDTRDLDALLRLEERCFQTPWTRSMYEQELARPAGDAVRLAARESGGGNGRLVGAAIAARIGGAWHVMNVLVDPSARGRRIATRLVDELLARTRVLGAGEGWTLEVRDGNDAAIALYEHQGFEHAGRRPGYYADTGEDALVMWRHATSDDAAVVR